MLLGHVDGTHVDLALQPEQGGCGRQRHTVLPRAGLRDQLLLAHPLGQQPLTQAVVDLVGTGVVEVLAFEVDLHPAKMPSQPNSRLLFRGSLQELLQFGFPVFAVVKHFKPLRSFEQT